MLTLTPITLGLTALAGALGYWAYTAYATPPGATHALGNNGHATGGSTLHGAIVAQPAFGSPAPFGVIPQAGLASRDDYEWGYLVGPGDSAGSIAEAIVGDDGRYQELIHANPSIPTVGDAGVYVGDRAYNFAPNTLPPGTGLLLPVPWSRYVDQLGHPKGDTVAYPKDLRGPIGMTPPPPASAPPAALPLSMAPTPDLAHLAGTAGLAGGRTPYGQVVALDERTAA